MSCLPNQTNITQGTSFFLLANASTLNSGNVFANNVSTGNLLAGGGTLQNLNFSTLTGSNMNLQNLYVSSLQSDGKIDANVFSSIFTYAFEGTVSTLFTEHIILDQATLDVVGGNVLLLNGIPLATTSTSISSLEEWSYYPALSTLNMANNDIANLNNLNSQNIFNALNIQTDSLAALTNLTAPKATLTTLNNSNFSSFNFVASNATLPNVIGGAAAFSTLNTSSIFTSSVRGSVGVFSTLNVSSINGLSSINAAQWANYPATSNVNMNGFDITGGSQGSFQIQATSNLTETAGISYCNVVDRGIDVTGAALINLNAKNGLQGSINIQADPGIAGVFGRVDITANGGTTGGVGTGGLITINANTPLGFSNATSAVKINAAGVNSYAGLIPSVGSLAGYNFIYGTNGVNICAGLPPSFPNIPFTTYLYGTAGVTTSSDFYAPNIYPYWNGVTNPPDLFISGRYIVPNLYQVYLQLSNVKNMFMDSTAAIQNCALLNMSNGTISNANNISGTGSVSGYTSLSGTTVSGTNGSFGTLSNTNLIGTGTVTGYTSVTAGALSTITLRGSNLTTSSINVSSIVSPIYGAELRLINTLPGSSQGGSGSNAVTRLIAYKPSGVSTVAQLVAADTGATVGAFKADGTLTNLLLNASSVTISTNLLQYGTTKQPYIQYGRFTGSGGTGNSTITLNVPYANTNYVGIPVMDDTNPAQMSLNVLSPSTFTVYWANAGGGSQNIGWTTYGDV